MTPLAPPPVTALALEHTVGNSDLLERVPGMHEDNLVRDAGIIIRRVEGKDSFELFPNGDLFAPRTWLAEIPLTPTDLFGHVQRCRQVWQQVVVDLKETVDAPAGGVRNAFPLQDGWDHAARPAEWLPAIGAPLAVAGAELFFHLFEEGDARLTRVADRLREASRRRPLILTITSDTFFVPWGLLYVHPDPATPLAGDGSNFSWDGFWGGRHIVEHNTVDVDLETALCPDASGQLPASINVDETIDSTLNVACIAPQLEFFKSLASLTRVERRSKAALQLALSADGFSDRIVYFCCHGQGAGSADAISLQPARIALSDGQPITGAEIAFWLKRRGLASQPLVFINACQGGQMTTLFYQTLAAEFLKQNAVGLLGAQIDIPAVFAAEYAQRFFRQFLGGSRVRVGPLVRDLAREFLTKHQNPLGLVYSLYRGADCFVNWQPTAAAGTGSGG